MLLQTAAHVRPPQTAAGLIPVESDPVVTMMDIRDLDRNAVRNLPALVGLAGLTIVRRERAGGLRATEPRVQPGTRS